MSTMLVIDPQKLREARGTRTQDEIVEAAGHRFSAQQLSGWEKGKYRPRPHNIPPLLNALGVTYEAVASPIENIAAEKNLATV